MVFLNRLHMYIAFLFVILVRVGDHTTVADHVTHDQQLFLENLAAVLTQSKCPNIPAGFWSHQLRLKLPCSQFDMLPAYHHNLKVFRKSLSLGSTTTGSLLLSYMTTNNSLYRTSTYNNTVQSLYALQDLFMALEVQNQFVDDSIMWLLKDDMRFGGVFKSSGCVNTDITNNPNKSSRRRRDAQPEFLNKLDMVHNFNQMLFDPTKYSSVMHGLGLDLKSSTHSSARAADQNNARPQTIQSDIGYADRPSRYDQVVPVHRESLYDTHSQAQINIAPETVSHKNTSGIYNTNGDMVLSSARDALYKKLVDASTQNKRELFGANGVDMEDDHLLSQVTYQSSATWTLCSRNKYGDEICKYITLRDLHNNYTRDYLNRWVKSDSNIIVKRVSRSVNTDAHSDPTVLHRVYTPNHLTGGVWNIALNSDLALVNKATNALSTNQIKLATIIGKNQDYVLTMQALNDKNFQELDTKINLTMEILANYSTDLHSYLYNLQQEKKNLIQQNQMVDAIIMLHTTATKLMQFQNDLQKYCNDLTSHYIKIIDSIIHKRLYLNLRSLKEVNKDIIKIASKLSAGLQIATGQSLLPFLKDSSATVFLDQTSLVYSYDIPLIQGSGSMSCYHLVYIPVWVKGKWLSLVTDPTHFMIDESQKAWYALTEDDYSLCMNDAFNTCPVNHAKWTSGDSICIVGVLINRTISQEKCLFTATTIPSSQTVIVKSTGVCSWLISPGGIDIDFDQRCDMRTNPSSDINTGLINKPTHIVLKRGCSLSSREFHLECPTVVGKLEVKLDVEEIMLVNPELTSDWGVANEAMSSTKINYRDTKDTLQYNVPNIPRKYTPFLDHGITNVSRLLHSKVSDFKIMDSYDMINQIADDRQGDIAHPWLSFADFSGLFLYKWLTYVNSLIILITLIWCILRAIVARRNGGIRNMLTGGLLLNRLPGALSFSITKIQHKVASSISALSNETSPINHTINILDEVPHNQTSLGVMLIYMFVLMVVIHGLFMLVHCIWNRRRDAVLSAKLGWIPRNIKAVHHEGEVTLCVGILIDFLPWFPSNSIDTRELVIQLCTLPRTYTEWYCDVQGDVPQLVMQAELHKMAVYWEFVLEWGQFCIKSKDNPLLETCHDLPKVIKVDANECLAQLSLGHSLSWKKGKGHDIIKMFLLGKSYYRELYNRY